MGDPAEKLKHTFAEYLALEEKSDKKHEFWDGEIIPLGEILAMAGGTFEHGRLTMQLGGLIGSALKGRPCAAFSSDVRVRVRETDFCAYPDLSVVCGRVESDPQDKNSMTNPAVLVEVLSSSTEDYDHGTKWSHYRRIPSLRDYLLVSQREARIEHYQRNDDGTWTLRDLTSADSVRLSLGVEIAVADIYANPLQPEAPPAPATPRPSTARARPRPSPPRSSSPRPASPGTRSTQPRAAR